MVNHNDLGVPNFDASLIPLVSDDICFGWNLLHLSPTIRIPNYSSDKGTSWVRHQTSPEIWSIRRWQVRYPTIVYKHIRTSAFDSISMYINDQWYTYSSHVCWAWVLFLLHRRRTISNAATLADHDVYLNDEGHLTLPSRNHGNGKSFNV